MSYIPLELLSKHCDSYYKLVLVAAERANEILEGSPRLIVTDEKKHTMASLHEVLNGKIQVEYDDSV